MKYGELFNQETAAECDRLKRELEDTKENFARALKTALGQIDSLKEELEVFKLATEGGREVIANRRKEIDSLKEENERLKQWKLEAEEQLDLQHELNKHLKEKDFYREFTNAFEVNQKLISERDSLKQLNSELVEVAKKNAL